MSKNRPHARRAARSRAFQVLYSLQFSPSTTLGDVRTAFLEMPDPTDADMDEKRRNPRGKAVRLRVGAGGGRLGQRQNPRQRHRTLLAELARGSLGKIELTLLRLAVFEMLYRADVPPKVAINEAA